MARTPGRTPGVLNPLMYENKSEFRKALLEVGRSMGWTPRTRPTDDDVTPPQPEEESK